MAKAQSIRGAGTSRSRRPGWSAPCPGCIPPPPACSARSPAQKTHYGHMLTGVSMLWQCGGFWWIHAFAAPLRHLLAQPKVLRTSCVSSDQQAGRERLCGEDCGGKGPLQPLPWLFSATCLLSLISCAIHLARSDAGGERWYCEHCGGGERLRPTPLCWLHSSPPACSARNHARGWDHGLLCDASASRGLSWNDVDRPARQFAVSEPGKPHERTVILTSPHWSNRMLAGLRS